MDHLRLLAAANNTLLCGPSAVYIDLATACNINCRFCWNHSLLNKEKVFKKDVILPFPMVKDIVHAARRWHTREILLSGDGEPTLHPRIKEIIEYIKGNDMVLFLATNATFPERLLAAVSRVDYLFVDLCSPDEESYGFFQSPRNKSLFARVMKNLTVLSALKSKYKRPNINVAFIITRDNYAKIPEMMNLCDRLRIDKATFRIIETTRATKGLSLSPAHKKGLLKIIRDAGRRRFRFGHNLNEVGRGLTDFERSAYSFSKCLSGWFNVSIDVNRNVGICCHNENLVIGNLRDASLQEIWESERARQIRLLCKDGFDRHTYPFRKECEWCHWSTHNKKMERALSNLSHAGRN